MTRNFRTVKATIIVGLLMFSIAAAIVPTTSAGIIFQLQSVVTVTWSGNETADPVIPRGPIRPVQLQVTYRVNRGPFGAGILKAYGGTNAFIRLEVVDKSEWVSAALQVDTVPLPISELLQKGTAIISFQVQENAPAYGLGYIRIRASVEKLGLINGFDQTFTLNFVPSYKPLIDKELPEGKVEEIGPMETAEFPIEIINMGNARTKVFLDVVEVPEGWNAVINSEVTLEEAPGSKATAYLVVRPPKDFGYHHDEDTIKISLLPVRADNYKDQGEMLYETFLIQSRGFSTPGFEVIFFIGALLIVVLLIKYKKKK